MSTRTNVRTALELVTATARSVQEPARAQSERKVAQLAQPVVARLWRRMGEIYGHRWRSAFGDRDTDDTWAISLADMSAEEIGNGLQACLQRADGWPPTLPEFRAMCRPPKVKRENAAAHRYAGPSLPHLLSDEQRVVGRAAIAAARAAMRNRKPEDL